MRILRMPFLCQHKEDIDSVVHTAAIVHNKLLEHDGFAQKFDDIDPSYFANDVEAQEDDEPGWRPVRNHGICFNGVVVGAMDDYTGQGLQLQRLWAPRGKLATNLFEKSLRCTRILCALMACCNTTIELFTCRLAVCVKVFVIVK